MTTPSSAKNEDDARAPSVAPRRRELLAAITSGFVGAAALATSTYNVYLQRQQVRAQVLPRLVVGMELTDEGLAMNVANRGVGPAEVRRLRVRVDGASATDWIEVAVRLLRTSSLAYVPRIAELEGTVIGAGQDVAAFQVTRFDDAVALFKERRRLAFEVCYCSTLDDCWAVSFTGAAPPVTASVEDGCHPDPKPFESVSNASKDQIVEHIQDAGRGRAMDAPTAP